MSRDSFGSSFGALMAVIGSAVGLGVMWKFPYMVGKNGGAAFIVVYLAFTLILCLPMILCEFAIGRRAQANPVGAYKKLAPKTKWHLAGIPPVVAAFLILSFYAVVGGWTIEYIFSSVGLGYNAGEGLSTREQFEAFTQSPIRPLLFHILFLGTTVYIVLSGVKNGIEKYSKILMPILFLMVVVLAVRSLMLEGAGKGVEFLFKPDFSVIDGKVMLDALGMGLFSLSLCTGSLITYASYMGKKEKLQKIAIVTIISNTVFALIAGLAILPAVFALGFAPDEGYGLAFIVLPKVFELMPGGIIFAVIFFFALTVAALTSAISQLEVIVAYFSEELKLKRKTAVWTSAILLTITGFACSLSQGVLSDVRLFGLDIFGVFDWLSSNFLMPVGGILMAIFVGWAWKRSEFYDELSNGGTLKVRMFSLMMFLIKFVAPLIITVIFLNALGLISL